MNTEIDVWRFHFTNPYYMHQDRTRRPDCLGYRFRLSVPEVSTLSAVTVNAAEYLPNSPVEGHEGEFHRHLGDAKIWATDVFASGKDQGAPSVNFQLNVEFGGSDDYPIFVMVDVIRHHPERPARIAVTEFL